MVRQYTRTILVLLAIVVVFRIVSNDDIVVLDIPPLKPTTVGESYFEQHNELPHIANDKKDLNTHISNGSEQPLSGVTLIIHGFDIGLNVSSFWAEDLQAAIMKQSGENSQAAIISVRQIDDELQAELEITEELNFNGEIVIRIDWSAVANHMISNVSTQQVADAVAPLLYQKLLTDELAFTDFPLHIIAHSRGVSIAYEIARLLGEQAIEVEHLTSLDPHPLTELDVQPLMRNKIIDTEIIMHENILFADNYWQDMSYPQGQHIEGAYNRLWTALEDGSSSLAGGYHNIFLNFEHSFANHLNIILMYQGTVDLDTPISSGLARMTSQERDLWYNANEQRGAKTGYYFKKQR